MRNTFCKNCIFAKTSSNDDCCEFGIVSRIKDSKCCEIKEDYWYIKNYECKFALGTNLYNTKIQEILGDNKLDLKQHIAYQNTIRYYLVINVIDNDYTIDQLCNNLKQLEIPPKFVSIIFYREHKEFMIEAVESFKTIIGNSIEYKIHNFIEDITTEEALFSVLETTIKKNNTQYLWLLNNSSLTRVIKDGDIEQINYQINVMQPACNMLKSKHSNKNLDTLFLNFENYIGITKNINQSLSAGILSLPHISINNYD